MQHRVSEFTHFHLANRDLRRQISRVTGAAGLDGNNFLDAASSAASRPLVSVVVPVFNNWSLTRRCLAAIAASSAADRLEVIVVDDLSTDETVTSLPALLGITSVRNDENLGFVRTANRGAAMARGEHVLFVNNDALLLPTCIDALLNAMDDPTIGAVGAKLIAPSSQLREAGSLVWQDGICSNIGRNGDSAASEYNFRRDVDYCSGAALMVRSSLLRELGYFDERFAPAYYEDVDLCFGLRALGYRVVYEPSAVAVHLEGMTHGTDMRPALAGATSKSFQAVNRGKFVDKWTEDLRHRRAVTDDVDRNELLGTRTQPKPRVLVCDWVIPATDRDSTSHRMDAILRLLVPLADRVTLVPKLRGANHEYAGRLRKAGVEVMCPSPRSFEGFLKSRAGLYDLVILSRMAVAAGWLELVRRFQSHACVAFDTVDLHSLRYARERETIGTVPGADPEGARDIERRLIASCDVTIAITETEAGVIRDMAPSARTAVLPNVHEIRTNSPPGPKAREGLLFIGSFLHSPNADAVAWFVKEILPHIRKRVKVKLVVVGSDPPPSLVRSCGPEVVFSGWVHDVQPLFDSAKVFVAPLRFGAGMKGKVGHAFALGLPVVTTGVGAEGMDLEDGCDALIRDDPRAFADAVVQLYEDASLWMRLSGNGQRAVEERWSPDKMQARLRRLLRESVGRKEPVSLEPIGIRSHRSA